MESNNLQQPGKINAVYLEQHFTDSSSAESTRLAVLLATLGASTLEETGKAVRDWTKGYSPVKTPKDGEKPEETKVRIEAEKKRQAVVSTRGGEIKALKAALDYGWKHEGKGYGPTIASARAFLAVKGIGTNGKPVVDAEERKANKAQRDMLQSMLDSANKTGKPVTADTFEAAQAEAAEAVKKDTALRLARVVIARHGVEIAALMADSLHALIEEQQRAAANKTAQEASDKGFITDAANNGETVDVPAPATGTHG